MSNRRQETAVLTDIMPLVMTDWINDRAATTPCAILDYVKTPLLKPCKAHHTRQATYWLLPASLLYSDIYQLAYVLNEKYQAICDRNRTNPKYKHATSYGALNWKSHRMLHRNWTEHFTSQKVQTYCASTTETNLWMCFRKILHSLRWDCLIYRLKDKGVTLQWSMKIKQALHKYYAKTWRMWQDEGEGFIFGILRQSLFILTVIQANKCTVWAHCWAFEC